MRWRNDDPSQYCKEARTQGRKLSEESYTIGGLPDGGVDVGRGVDHADHRRGRRRESGNAHADSLPYLKYPAPLLKPVSSPRMNIYPFSAPHNKQNRTSSVCNIGLLSRVACMSALSSSRNHAGKSRELKTCAIAHAKDWNQAELDGRPCAFL